MYCVCSDRSPAQVMKATSSNPADVINGTSINCGSVTTSASANGKKWIGDVKPKPSTLLQIRGSSTTSTAIDEKPIYADTVPHKTARISHHQFSYIFRFDPGQKIVRLHFNSAIYKGFKGLKDLFTVEAGSFILLSNFSAALTAHALGIKTFIKEFCISIEEHQELNLSFSPVKSRSQDRTYAFINGIEIISVPVHLSYFRGRDVRAQVVGQRVPVCIDNTTALELIHRLNLKRNSGPSGDAFDDMLEMWTTAQKDTVQKQMGSLTWNQSVDVGFRYLVRIYFSKLELKNAENGELTFRVLIDEMVVDTNMEIVKNQVDHGSPSYRDYVVAIKGLKQEGKRGLSINLQSNDELINGHRLLEGFEIYKISNPDNSLGSPHALPPARVSSSWIIKKVESVLGRRNTTATIIIAILALIDIIVYNTQKVREASIPEDENKPFLRAEQLCRQFSLSEIRSATKNFSKAYLIGRGGFGKVYKGFIDNGKETVAIKRLKSNSKQGKNEFLTEIELLCELHHINIVSLIGYCNEQGEMIVVYEYMACGTLADHLYKLDRDGNKYSSLTWKECLNICIGAGRGLDYLHTGNGVIHRDVKTSNILLDENLIAKVSDLGLAKPEERSKLMSHVSTKVKGTFGYFDPYYFSTHKLTRKSDTYSFGVVLLEVLCWRPAMDSSLEEDACYLTKLAQNKINKGEIEQIIATNLVEEISPLSLKVFVGVAERCLHNDPKERPTMAQVVLQLELALEQQENRKVTAQNEITSNDIDACPADLQNIAPASTEHQMQPVIPYTDQTKREIDNTLHPPRRKTAKKRKMPKPLWPWAGAFWNGLKLFKKKRSNKSDSAIFGKEINQPKLSLAKIEVATNHFSSSNRIGHGGYGSVYKGVFPTGQKVAVKVFSVLRPSLNEFKSRILLLSHLNHENIVKLLGYCIHDKRVMLVYEFMENGSLDRFIFDKLQRQLQWSHRFNIIMGVAKGILYIHQGTEKALTHGDIKPGNILLDIMMNPKISGFGTAKNYGDHESKVETRVVGTLGYIPPEYAMFGICTDKVDVYSFGMLVLEILSGRRNMEYQHQTYNESLIEQAWKLWKEGKELHLVDESLRGEYSEDEAGRCIHVSLLCTHANRQNRPTMASVLKMLLGEEMSLQEKVAEAADSAAKFEFTDQMERNTPRA
ncbi:putative receptor-like protein kinase At5g39000 isoform X2 [Andrographis paniculata]|uniref:putative receptor-like protein kinase At5g39000 isoform X2 n=1 Tax=Andrographis paniculata TaxID=175694 RepID=UPI0021E8F724|nr:putative receptor-like protein kinase At5g39000 isoform X2 [Andrographis paniculata]